MVELPFNNADVSLCSPLLCLMADEMEPACGTRRQLFDVLQYVRLFRRRMTGCSIVSANSTSSIRAEKIHCFLSRKIAQADLKNIAILFHTHTNTYTSNFFSSFYYREGNVIDAEISIRQTGKDNAGSYYVTFAPDAASLVIHALTIGSSKWRSNSAVCVRASIDRTVQIPRRFSCARKRTNLSHEARK